MMLSACREREDHKIEVSDIETERKISFFALCINIYKPSRVIFFFFSSSSVCDDINSLSKVPNHKTLRLFDVNGPLDYDSGAV